MKNSITEQARTVEPPVVPAYRKTWMSGNKQVEVYLMWCEWCYRWHTHAASGGHRVAHCFSNAPYKQNGYILQYAGEWTPEIEASHGLIPYDIQGLSDEELLMWSIAYGYEDYEGYKNKHGGRGRFTALRLANMFRLNGKPQGPSTDLLQQATYLSWRLNVTPEVHVSRTWQKDKPIKYGLLHERIGLLPSSVILETIFPPDADPVRAWLGQCFKLDGQKAVQVSTAWYSFKEWVKQNGPDYACSEAEWLRYITHETPVSVGKVDGVQCFIGGYLLGKWEPMAKSINTS